MRWAPTRAVLRALVLAGCATAPKPAEEPIAEPIVEAQPDPWRFEPDLVLTDEAIRTLRAGPPPLTPAVIDTDNATAEDMKLRAQGHLHVGHAWFATNDAEFDAHVLALGTRLAADVAVVPRLPVPPMVAATEPVPEERQVAYYVRFRPPFGAGFRDLDESERKAAGNRDGVKIISVIGASPAADANILDGDVVLAFDGTPVVDATGFKAMLREHAGKPVTLLLLRGAERVRRQVQLGVLPTQPAQPQ